MSATASVNISMPPSVWGPIFWHAMHIASLGYPVQPTEVDKAGMKAFFESLQTVIPCPVCREHYKQHLKEMPVDEARGSRGDLVFWVWTLHNSVNRMLDKPEYSLDAFIEHMQALGSGGGGYGIKGVNPMHVGMGVGAGLLVGGVLTYVFYKKLRT